MSKAGYYLRKILILTINLAAAGYLFFVAYEVKMAEGMSNKFHALLAIALYVMVTGWYVVFRKVRKP